QNIEVTGPSYSVSTSLPPLAVGTYYWRVRAINSQGIGGTYSATWNFTLKTAVPATPNLVSPAFNAFTTSQHPTLTWQAVTGAKSYVLDVAKDVIFTPRVVTHQPVRAPAVSYALNGITLDYGTTYYWQVAAVDVAGNTSLQGPIYQFTV